VQQGDLSIRLLVGAVFDFADVRNANTEQTLACTQLAPDSLAPQVTNFVVDMNLGTVLA
jgi:hypothetical protein